MVEREYQSNAIRKYWQHTSKFNRRIITTREAKKLNKHEKYYRTTFILFNPKISVLNLLINLCSSLSKSTGLNFFTIPNLKCSILKLFLCSSKLCQDKAECSNKRRLSITNLFLCPFIRMFIGVTVCPK